MKIILNLVRSIIGALTLGLAGLSVVILGQGIAIDGAEDYVTFSAIGIGMLVIGVGAFCFKKIEFRQWLRLIFTCILFFGSAILLSSFIENHGQWHDLVGVAYLLFLASAQAWHTFSKDQSHEAQTKWVAAFIAFTFIFIAFGMIRENAKGLLIFIALSAFLIFYMSRRLTRNKTTLLFSGQYEALRKRLVPTLIPHDAVLEAYTYFYSENWTTMDDALLRWQPKIKKGNHTGRYLEYVKASLSLQKAFYLGEKEEAKLHFEHMLALNKQLFKKGYPMASAYAVAYLMDLYEDEAFKKEVENAIAFEKNFSFKGQTEAFHKQVAFEQALISAAMAYKDSGSLEDLTALERVEKESIAPIYRNYSEVLKKGLKGEGL